MDKFLKKSEQSSVKENEPNQQKGTKRKFKGEYMEYGFIVSGPEDAQVPYCLICNSTLSNESLVPNKLKRHLESNHPAPNKNQENILKSLQLKIIINRRRLGFAEKSLDEFWLSLSSCFQLSV